MKWETSSGLTEEVVECHRDGADKMCGFGCRRGVCRAAICRDRRRTAVDRNGAAMEAPAMEAGVVVCVASAEDGDG